MSKNAKKQLKSIQAEQIAANSLMEYINFAFQAYDFETGNGENVPKLLPLGNQKFELKVGNETWIMTLEKK